MTYEELESIDDHLLEFTYQDQDAGSSNLSKTDDLYSIMSHPHLSKHIPDLNKIDKSVERAEKQLVINRSSSIDFGQKERSFIMVKPDGLQRGLVGSIVQKFEDRGFKLIAMKVSCPLRDKFEMHYQNLKVTPYFNKVVDYMLTGPVCQMVWEGDNVISVARMMLGETKPSESEPGTIRGDFGVSIGRNICHGSDSLKNAEKEINLWFDRSEIWSRR